MLCFFPAISWQVVPGGLKRIAFHIFKAFVIRKEIPNKCNPIKMRKYPLFLLSKSNP
jgi:hypothetical protein